ncbi:MAG: glucose-1-phosphate cytidylyltransferase [Verrucomicrobia bacterium]|nr:glucose-1-phosphate cytidylyltransferase [Verrucomicrobiota bacterium]
MKAVILAGGIGSRISEESLFKPKPMIEIGDRPIIWHIMKMYAHHGIRDFIVCCGYKGYMINEYFMNFVLSRSDVTFDLADHSFEVIKNRADSWKVTCIDTGLNTMTGGRIKRVKDFIGEDTFCLTYGDGVSDLNLTELINFHKAEGRLATITAVQPPGRWGAFTLSGHENKVNHFREKPEGDGAWVNGGFFVLEASVFDYIEGDETTWEQTPLEQLARSDQLSAYRHFGFWQPMDTLRDKNYLESLWEEKNAPWRVW